jgi:3'-5' exoribonuclease
MKSLDSDLDLENAPIDHWQAPGLYETEVILVGVEAKPWGSGKVRYVATLRDATGEIPAVDWDGAIRGRSGEIMKVRAVVGEYRKELQATIKSAIPALDGSPGDEAVLDAVIPTAGMPRKRAEYLIRSAIDKLPLDDGSQEFAIRIIGNDGDDVPALDRGDTPALFPEFWTWPAAQMAHHATRGGLAEHVAEMMRLADPLIDSYQLDQSLVTLGILVHDLGKILELDRIPGADKTQAGIAIGHVGLGLMLLYDDDELNGMLGTDRFLGVCHIIASHHGQLEWGAVVPPRTPEAHFVHHLDMISSRANMAAGAVAPSHEWPPGDRQVVRHGLLGPIQLKI